MHPFFTSSGPAVFAHRGGGALAPENTLAAFERGLTLGADGIELDVQLSRDGAVVVHHDAPVDRVCIGSSSLRGLRTVRAAEPAIATSAARQEVRWAVYRAWMGRPPSPRAQYSVFQVPEFAGTTRVVSRRFVDLARRAGRPVQVWTINHEDDGRRLLGWGVQALITDRPDIMVPLVRGGR